MQKMKSIQKCMKGRMPERLKNTEKIARVGEKKIRDLYTMKCVKDENQKILIHDEKIKKNIKIISTQQQFYSKVRVTLHLVSRYELQFNAQNQRI